MRNTENKVSSERGIPFTQYMLPDGRTEPVFTRNPEFYTDEVYDKAQKILDAGYTFGVEMLMTGQVIATIEDRKEEVDVEICIASNDKMVSKEIAAMILRFKIPEKEAVDERAD